LEGSNEGPFDERKQKLRRLRARASVLSGILNGVDYRIWDPVSDPHIAHTFTPHNLRGKRTCKATLRRELGLGCSEKYAAGGLSELHDRPEDDNVVVDAWSSILACDLQIAIVGEGNPRMEDDLREAAKRHPGQAALRIGYDEPLAHRLLAGADILPHPSRFEPCGLTHRYAMCYGTLPIIRRTSLMGREDCAASK